VPPAGLADVASPYELRPVPDGAGDRWESFVADHPAATVFHSRAWLAALRDAFAYDPASHLLYETGGTQPVGAIPAVSIPGLGGRTVVNPFCEYGFPLLAESVDPAPALRALAADVGPFGARVIKDAAWRGPEGYHAAGYGAVETGEVIRLDTDRSFEAVRSTSFTSEARRCVRSARDQGLTVRPGSVTEYYPLYLETMRRLGSPQFPESFFLDLAVELGDDLVVFVAEESSAGDAIAGGSHDSEPVGGVLALDFGGTRTIWSNASRIDAWDRHPNHLLYASAIRDACETDIQIVDFGRSRPGSGVHGFKREFGGQTSSLASFVIPPHRAGRASLAGYGKVAAVARRLAPAITNPAVGPRLKRYIHE